MCGTKEFKSVSKQFIEGCSNDCILPGEVRGCASICGLII